MSIEEEFLALPKRQREEAFKVVKAKRKIEDRQNPSTYSN
jgi:hypothetical protein